MVISTVKYENSHEKNLFKVTAAIVPSNKYHFLYLIFISFEKEIYGPEKITINTEKY